MSLFEKIKNKRTSLQEKATKDETPLKDRVNKGSGSRTTRVGGNNDPLKQKAEAEYVKYTDELAKKSGITGKNPGKKLEKQVDTGLKKQDGTIGKRTPSKGYAQGEPFQGNTNVKDPTGKYPASGRSTLQGRQRYQFDIAKTSRKDAAKARLVTRIQKVKDPFFADKGGKQDVKKITKYVDDITKNQTLSKGKGTKSSLFKTLKSYTDAKNPTIKGASGGKLPMPDGPKKDAKVKANLQKLDDKIARQAKLPKGTYIPKGGVFPKSDIKTKQTSTKLSVPFEPKETNIQYKSDKLDLDYGKRFAERDGLTAAERKKKLKDLQRKLNIKNPTATSRLTGGQLPKGSAAPLNISTKIKKTQIPGTSTFKPNLKNLKQIKYKTGTFNMKGKQFTSPKFNTKLSKLPLGKFAKYGIGAYVLNQVLNPKGDGGGVIPPSNKNKIKNVKLGDLKYNLSGPGGDGYKPAGMKK